MSRMALHDVQKVAVPDDVRRRLINFVATKGRTKSEQLLSCSANTLTELLSIGARVRKEVLERVQRRIVMEGIK